MKTRSACRFELLGTTAVVASPVPEIVDRVAFCYAAARCDTDACRPNEAHAVSASVAEDLTVLVDGRPPRAAADAVEAVRTLNHELMHALMRRRPELLYVHAGVAAVDGRAVVLPGLSRAGKSTLVVALLAAGARFLSDELLAYDPEGHRAIPFPRAPKVRDECIGYFPGLERRCTGQGEGRFLPLDPGCVAAAAAPALVVVPRWDPAADDRLEPRATGAVLLHLVRSVLNFGSHRTRAIDHLAQLAGRTTGGELAWSDPHAAARGILDALARAHGA